MERFWAKVHKTDSCWLWTGAHSSGGYGTFRLNGRTIRAHRFAYEVLVGTIPAGLMLCHHCDTPACVNPDHLFAGTMADNVRDRDAKQRRIAPCGEKNGFAKLTADQVREIRRRYVPRKVSLSSLAREYGVDHTTIHAIVRGENWKEMAV